MNKLLNELKNKRMNGIIDGWKEGREWKRGHEKRKKKSLISNWLDNESCVL